MPVFEIQGEGIIPFRRVPMDADLYEERIEALLWDNLEEFVGVPLFPVRRQARLPGSGIPDIVALDPQGSVYVIEVKRDVERRQLSQGLEYAGWARSTSLDELASMFHRGTDEFWSGWQAFTDTETPVLVRPFPKLVLVARDFASRTQEALDFLLGYDLPVLLLRATVYRDSEGRELMDVQGAENEVLAQPTIDSSHAAESARARPRTYKATLLDLIEGGHLAGGDELVWERPQLGLVYRATLTDQGDVQLEDGRTFSSPSTAGTTASGNPTLNGWTAWRAPARGNRTLAEIRDAYESAAGSDDGILET